jgi:hypothetical protein
MFYSRPRVVLAQVRTPSYLPKPAGAGRGEMAPDRFGWHETAGLQALALTMSSKLLRTPLAHSAHD